MITAFLHVVVDVVITCISATWSPAQICMTTQHKEHFMYIHRPTCSCFMSDMTLNIGLERKGIFFFACHWHQNFNNKFLKGDLQYRQ